MELQNSNLDDIAAVIGFSATLRLVAWYGDGNNLYVPAQAEEEHQIVKLIGISAARKLCEEFGPAHLNISKLQGYEMDVKRRWVCRMVTKGFGTREVATYFGMTERRVQQICRELEAAGLLDPKVVTKNSKEENAPEKHPQENAMEKAGEEFSGEHF